MAAEAREVGFTSRTIRGATIPSPGFGTWQLQGRLCRTMVEKALKLGYRHLDTAQAYGNEEEIGDALMASSLKRWDVFLASKVSPRNYGEESFRKSVEGSVRRLKTDQLDLLLLHWPAFRDATLPAAIEQLNAVHSEGLAKHIGVSNFPSDLLEEAWRHTSAPLVVNQVEYHPFLNQDGLLTAMDEKDMLLVAYCPVAQGRAASNPVLQEIGKAHGKTGAQVALRWLIQRGTVPLPRTSDPHHAAENLNLFDFQLTPGEMERISRLHEPDGRIIDPPGESPEWD